MLGRPDLSILESHFEKGDKFYEPQYSVTKLDSLGDENGSPVDIRFRESESQLRAEQAMTAEVLRG